MSVLEGVDRELAELRKRDKRLAESGLAEMARALAEGIDSSGNSFTSRSIAAKELRDTMAAIRDLAPVAVKHDKVDELAKRRADRLAARGSGAAG